MGVPDRLLWHACEGPHRECAEAFDLWRHCAEAESSGGQLFQSSHVFAYEDVLAQKGTMSGPFTRSGRIDVVGIDAYQYRAAVAQVFRRRLGKEGMVVEISWGVPVCAPTRVDQDGFAGDLDVLEVPLGDLESLAMVYMHHHCRQV